LNEPEDQKALSRQRVILAVLAGRLSVTQAALQLGVSRKTFYQWQARALAAMQSALQDRPGGRPPRSVDPESRQLQARVEGLEKERWVLEGRLRIRQAIQDTWDALQQESPPSKKKRTV
jgi:transposase